VADAGLIHCNGVAFTRVRHSTEVAHPRSSRGGGGRFERDAFPGGHLPAIGSDFDELALGIGEVEEDLFGSGGGAAEIDAVGDANAAGIGIAGGLGVEVMEDGAEGVGGGNGVVVGEALVEEPPAKGAGADGECVIAGGQGGNGHEGAPVDGSEGDAAMGNAEESVEAGGRARGFG